MGEGSNRAREWIAPRARLTRRRLAAALLALPATLGHPTLGRAAAIAAARETRPLTIVVGGLDTRGGDEPENTDVLILARVDLRRATVRAVSIPRDLYVAVPGYGWDKVNRAYDHGLRAAGESDDGLALLVATVAENFGVEANGVVLTTFDGFVRIVDTLGGVEVVNPYAVADPAYPTTDYGTTAIFYPEGRLSLDGAAALEFVRTRHQDADDGRIMRQQLVLRALLARAQEPAVAAPLLQLVEASRRAVRTTLTSRQRLALVLTVPEVRDAEVRFATIGQFLWPGSTPGGAWIWQGDWAQIPAYVQGVLDGTVDI